MIILFIPHDLGIEPINFLLHFLDLHSICLVLGHELALTRGFHLEHALLAGLLSLELHELFG